MIGAGLFIVAFVTAAAILWRPGLDSRDVPNFRSSPFDEIA